MTNTDEIKDYGFVVASVSMGLWQYMDEEFPEYFEQWGVQHYYDMVAYLSFRMMFGGFDTKYQEFQTNKKVYDPYGGMDCYYQGKAKSFINENTFNFIAGFTDKGDLL
jgi:hypothetical protein